MGEMKRICIHRLLEETKDLEQDEEPLDLWKVDIDALLDHNQIRPLTYGCDMKKMDCRQKGRKVSS